MSGLAECLDAKITSAWSAANYYRTELLVGVGQSFVHWFSLDVNPASNLLRRNVQATTDSDRRQNAVEYLRDNEHHGRTARIWLGHSSAQQDASEATLSLAASRAAD